MTATTPNLRTLVLKSGSHISIAAGMCAMEAVAWLANEPHSDAPQCACPVIAAFVRRLNDRMPDDATRTKYLRPLLKKIVGTRSTREVEIKRGYIAADFACREAAPMALEARGRKGDAAKLRALDPIVDKASARRAQAAADAHAAAASVSASAADATAAAYAADAAADAAGAYDAEARATAYDAAASSAGAATNAAYAAAATYAIAASARSPSWLAAVGCLRRMIEAGK